MAEAMPVNRATHPCGCKTYFDLLRWRSVTTVWCSQHANLYRAEATR